jgi:DNA-directed RNA polymerase specialized sigma24 family protein
MVNTAISWRRRRRFAEQSLVTDGPAAADHYAQVDARDAVLGALRRLPPKMRAVVVLRYFEDLSEETSPQYSAARLAR